MTYRLFFLTQARDEWDRLTPPIQVQFKKKLAERLENPHVPASRLSGSTTRYKIKLRAAGYRLVYQVNDQQVTVLVIAVGRRDKNRVYREADRR
jgi:mRNA interferase RelE/StbE